ncbi:MAG: Gx transporter family protein [Halanaerobium sp.]|nr:Gx transporter family protein [Halanaerobium sp.]
MRPTKKITTIAILVTLALVLHIVELFLPIPFIVPGFKLGLANIVTVTALCLFGFGETLLIVLLRTFLAAFLTGAISSFFYSVAGGILSLLVMFLVYRYLDKYVSLTGVSVLGAVAHNVGQLLVASIILDTFAVFSYLPILLLSGIATGYFVGLVSRSLLGYIRGKVVKSI